MQLPKPVAILCAVACASGSTWLRCSESTSALGHRFVLCSGITSELDCVVHSWIVLCTAGSWLREVPDPAAVCGHGLGLFA